MYRSIKTTREGKATFTSMENHCYRGDVCALPKVSIGERVSLIYRWKSTSVKASSVKRVFSFYIRFTL